MLHINVYCQYVSNTYTVFIFIKKKWDTGYLPFDYMSFTMNAKQFVDRKQNLNNIIYHFNSEYNKNFRQFIILQF